MCTFYSISLVGLVTLLPRGVRFIIYALKLHLGITDFRLDSAWTSILLHSFCVYTGLQLKALSISLVWHKPKFNALNDSEIPFLGDYNSFLDVFKKTFYCSLQ